MDANEIADQLREQIPQLIEAGDLAEANDQAWVYAHHPNLQLAALVRLLIAEVKLREGSPLLASSNLKIAETYGVADQDQERYERLVAEVQAAA